MAREAPSATHATIENVADDAQVFGSSQGDIRAEFGLQGKSVVLYTGTLEYYQGVDLLLRGFAEVSLHQPDAHLLIVGGQREQVDRYRQMAAVLHFTPHPDDMVREIHRVLRPGGQAILMTVNRRSWLSVLHKVMKVEIDHLDSPYFRQFSEREFRDLLSPFASVAIVAERFPVRTKVHGGLKARLYNQVFVDLFNALPRRWVRWSGHHLLAFASKLAEAPRAAPTG